MAANVLVSGSEGQANRRRFFLAYALLVVALGGAIAGAVILLGKPGTSTGGWSNWRPTASGSDGAKQIADYLGRRYRLPSGKQLVGVIATPPEVQNVPLAAIAIEPSSASSSSGGGIQIFPAAGGTMYILCGLGQGCSIAEGKPTVARAQLLRREALELALYTFKYIPGSKSVVAFFPPKAGESAKYVLFFRKQDLKEPLSQPLVRTLPSAKPPLPGHLPTAEGATVDHLTQPRLFSFQLQQAQDGSAVLVLSTPTA
jgi:hypothetical protein